MQHHRLDPAKSVSNIPVRVRFCETDLMGIVHHASYFAYFELARVEWLRRRGVNYAEWASEGTHLPVVEVNARYRASARFDDELVIETTLAELRSVSIRFDYRILRPATGGELLVEGSTRLASVGSSYTLTRFSKEALEILAEGERTTFPKGM